MCATLQLPRLKTAQYYRNLTINGIQNPTSFQKAQEMRQQYISVSMSNTQPEYEWIGLSFHPVYSIMLTKISLLDA